MPPVNASFIWQFFTQDLWPVPLQQGDLSGTLSWYGRVVSDEVIPALIQTIAITQAALVLSGVLALMWYPFASRWLVGRFSLVGRFKLLILRSVPELMLAYLFMLLFGPSALPAIFALALHNGGLIAFLLANHSEDAADNQRIDSASGVVRYFYQDLPQRYPAFLALLFYRWEVIMRESAIMGVLGIATLGFFIDSAFEEIRFDKAFFLILVAAMLNVVVDSVSRRVRRAAGLTTPRM
jgi:phosphonate transport system permease protein